MNGIYRVEWKASPAGPNWTPLTPLVTATGSLASFTDNSPTAAARFYRIVLLP